MKTFLGTALLFLSFPAIGQQQQDTTRRLPEVQIRPYFSTQPLLRSTGSIGLISQSLLDKQPGGSFVSAMNSISGLRMEERSPGSYRLSIRGSLLRSPFGVRNVKIYFDDFPLTDAGGNSYLNSLEVSGTNQIQILKGPQGSIYGANSGGVVLIQPQENMTARTAAAVKLEAAAYGTFRQNLTFGQQFNKYNLNITQAYQRSDGYRDHSAMDRKYFQILQKYTYAKDRQLKALIFYSDLHYNTPGGLTAAQYEENPKAARPADGALKSAIQQNAGIYSKTLFGGISHDWQLSNNFKHVVSVFSSYTDFRNPFLTNYEKRKELTLGLRSYLEYQRQTKMLNYRFNLGIESMQTASDIDNYGNDRGKATALKVGDELKAASNIAFAHFSMDLNKKWLLELSASANLYQYTYRSIFPELTNKKTNRFDLQFMPRLALSYLITPELSLRSAVSKGYSPPTISEVRASDNLINTDLQPESGWNYESGIRYQSPGNNIQIDLTGFYYQLQHAIVRRLNQDGTEYFINAGGTKQWGLESSFSVWLIAPNASKFIRGLQFHHAYTLSLFKFNRYADKTLDYSGNNLTGVPKHMLISSADVQFARKWHLFAQHNYTSSIPLNDANTVYARRYHLVQTRIGWKGRQDNRFPIEIFAGADNLLNEKYSLGNDLNAAGGRYFNAAAGRNFYLGLMLQFKKI
ncbi:TonB-dependent receptor [Pedobacter steynii]|uniref:TonB-dependent receptor n=1 Tax=Pedobacter steynii TaxID=430522 RepID=A0A1D7QHA9_9SPHI|nr:TonB-dependent receptor [Pedobacter steynii]AOM78058.1 TonB-dependent receptor [Pedobacter steynii]